jgi:hypothetical protein
MTLRLDDGSAQTAEAAVGSGYLSQSSATIYFGLPRGRIVSGIDVRWSDGSSVSYPAATGSLEYTLHQDGNAAPLAAE